MNSVGIVRIRSRAADRYRSAALVLDMGTTEYESNRRKG
jgi:hypothetical protein